MSAPLPGPEEGRTQKADPGKKSQDQNYQVIPEGFRVVVDVGDKACQMMIDPEGGHEVVSIFLPNLPEPGHRREGKQDGRQEDLFKVPTEFLFQQEVKSKDASKKDHRHRTFGQHGET